MLLAGGKKLQIKQIVIELFRPKQREAPMTDAIRSDRELLSEEQNVTDPTFPATNVTGKTVDASAEARTTSENRLSASGTATARALEEERLALFSSHEANDLRARWDSVQVGFVDDPRKAVEEADALIAETMKRLTEIFADERQQLERQWDRNDGSTEDFRVALRRYRSFFSRLLAV
jgi:hypothetical protein